MSSLEAVQRFLAQVYMQAPPGKCARGITCMPLRDMHVQHTFHKHKHKKKDGIGPHWMSSYMRRAFMRWVGRPMQQAQSGGQEQRNNQTWWGCGGCLAWTFPSLEKSLRHEAIWRTRARMSAPVTVSPPLLSCTPE